MKAKINLLILVTCLTAISALAESDVSNQPLVPLPSIPDFTRGDGWGLALGAAVEYESAYDGSDEYEIEFEPAGGVHYRRGQHLFFWEGMELGWRGLLTDNLLLQAGIRYEDGLEADDSEDGHLDGIEDRDSHIVGFIEARRSIGTNWRNWVAARVMGGPSDFGWLGVLAAGHRFGSQTDGTGTEVFAFTTFGNAKFINKDFGVTAEDSASSGMPETRLGGGYRSVGLSIIDRRYLTGNLQLVSTAGAELYSSSIQDSPIARKNFELEVGVSLLWQF